MTAVFTEQKIIKLKYRRHFILLYTHAYALMQFLYFVIKNFDCETGIFYSEREISGNGKNINLNVAVFFFCKYIYIYYLKGGLVMCFQSLSVDPLSGMVDLVALFHI